MPSFPNGLSFVSGRSPNLVLSLQSKAEGRNRGSRNMVLAFLREQGPHGRNSLADDVANAEETGFRGWQSR